MLPHLSTRSFRVRLLRSPLLCPVVFAAALVLAACSTQPAPTLPATAISASPDQRQVRIAALRDLGFSESDAGWELNLSGRVTFAINDATLSPQALGTVERVAQTLRSIGIERLAIEGHTDSQGSVGLNQDLSERRAEAVAVLFAARGFRLSEIVRRGFGFSRPVADNSTENGRQQNRRVTIIVPSL